MVPGVGPLVNAQNLVDFEQLIAKCKLKKAKYKTGMEMCSFNFKAAINAIC
jgi:predicted RNA-binding protein